MEISKECIAKGYYGCDAIKKEIDAVLHQNAIDRQNLGVSSTKKQKEEVALAERKRLRAVRHLDPDKIDRLIKEN